MAPDCGREPSVEKTLCPLPTWGDEGGVSFISAGGFGEPEILKIIFYPFIPFYWSVVDVFSFVENHVNQAKKAYINLVEICDNWKSRNICTNIGNYFAKEDVGLTFLIPN